VPVSSSRPMSGAPTKAPIRRGAKRNSALMRPGLECVLWKLSHSNMQALERWGLQAWTVCQADLVSRPVTTRYTAVTPSTTRVARAVVRWRRHVTHARLRHGTDRSGVVGVRAGESVVVI